MVKKQKNNPVSKKFIYILAGTQTLIFSLAILVLFLFTSVRTQNWNLPSTEMVYLIDSAISGLTQEATSIPDNSYQYIPEAKLRFKTTDNQKIVYSYNKGDVENGLRSSITITSNIIKRDSITELYGYNQVSVPNGQQLFDRVPGVQNCNKLFIISYDNDISSYYGDEYQLFKTLNSSNSEPLYIWKHTGTLCNAIKNTEVVEGLEEILISVDTY